MRLRRGFPCRSCPVKDTQRPSLILWPAHRRRQSPLLAQQPQIRPRIPLWVESLESPLWGESLFTAHDFIRDGEEEEQADTLTSLTSELTPDGFLETWTSTPCSMNAPKTAKIRRPRPRAIPSHPPTLPRRTPQSAERPNHPGTNRRPEPNPIPAAGPLLTNMDALMVLAESQLSQRFRDSGMSSSCNPAPAAPAPPSSFCENPN
jgi:hypothetical protein